MTQASAAETAYENPLIPNARLRQLYRAMLRMRLLGRALGSKRGGKQTIGFEAVLASTSVDLGPDDLVSDAIESGVIDFLRGTTLQTVLHPEKRAKRGPTAECGTAAELPHDTALQDRISLALGAAAGLKALATKKDKGEDEGSAPSGVVALYLRPEEVRVPLLRKSLALASTQQLPVVFVVLRTETKHRRTGLSAIASQHGVPGIAVDSDDAIAIYRVMQESIGHARIGGGPALIECVAFDIQDASRKKRMDGISNLERYIVQRGVASEMWIKREVQAFQDRLSR